jgi:flagellar protein FliS
MKNNLNNYQATDLLGKSPLELTIKVYDGAIASLNEAITNYKGNNLQGGYESMERARRFVVHLYTTLDRDRGGDVAANLSKLYAFLIDQINLVEATKDINSIDSSINVLKNVREGWVQLAQDMKNKLREMPDKSSEPVTNPKSISMSI